MNNLLYSLPIPTVTEAKALQLARSVTIYMNQTCPGDVVQAYLEMRGATSVIHWIAAFPSELLKERLLAQLQALPEYAMLTKN